MHMNTNIDKHNSNFPELVGTYMRHYFEHHNFPVCEWKRIKSCCCCILPLFRLLETRIHFKNGKMINI